jgi:aromatic-L-amino-acid decarboxylase
MTRGHRGSLRLRCRSLSYPSPCRFIPAHPQFHDAYPPSVFRAELDEKLTLARGAADALRRMAHIELVAEPELSLLAFRARPPGVDEGPPLDALNRRLLARVNAKQRVLLTGVMAGGRFLLRMCILSFRTHADRVDAALADVASSLAEVLEERRDGRLEPARGRDRLEGEDDD